MDKIRIIQVGCGKMSRYTMRYAIEKGYEIVGAYDISSDIVGKSINSIYKEVKSDIVIENISNLENIDEKFADIAVIETMSLLNDIKSPARII